MKFQIRSWTDWGTGEMKLVIFSEGNKDQAPGYTVYNLCTGEMHLVERGQQIPPSFIIVLPWVAADDLKKAFAEWVHEQGIRPDQEVKREAGNEGSLHATRYHLEDLRRLLKLPPPQEKVTVHNSGKEEIRP